MGGAWGAERMKRVAVTGSTSLLTREGRENQPSPFVFFFFFFSRTICYGHPLASASSLLGLQTYITMPFYYGFYKGGLSNGWQWAPGIASKVLAEA